MIDSAYLKQLAAGQSRVAVAYSGGVDSTALLYACHQAGLPILAIHINHQLQAPANDWQAQCEAFCAQHHIPIEVRRVVVERQGGESLEENARQMRYAAIAQVMQQQGISHLLTAHHEDDQIETVLIALFRGSGFAGLAGMPVKAPWPFKFRKAMSAAADDTVKVPLDIDSPPLANLVGNSQIDEQNQALFIIRPLLSTKKAELYEYAASHNLPFVEDPSNTDVEYRRNWLRNRLVPELEQVFPQYRASIRRLARQVADIRQEWDEQTTHVLRECSDDLNRLSLIQWQKYSDAVRMRVMRAWLAGHNIRLNEEQSLELERQLRISKGGIRQVSSACKLRVKGAWAQCVTDSS